MPLLLLLVAAGTASSQPNRYSTVQEFVAKYGLPPNDNDVARAAWTDKVAQTLAAKFPADGWGRKRNGPGRENNPDVVAIRPSAAGVPFACVDILRGSDGQAVWQVVNPPCAPPGEFVEVTPQDWLAEATTPPDPPIDTGIPQALADIQRQLAEIKAMIQAPLPSVAFPVYTGTIRLPYGLGSAPVTLTPQKQ